jgi:hypothetical protein
MEVARTADSNNSGIGSSFLVPPRAISAGAPQCGHIIAVVLTGLAHSAQRVMAMAHATPKTVAQKPQSNMDPMMFFSLSQGVVILG